MEKSEQLVFTADRYKIHRVSYAAGDGTPHQRDVIRHPGAVVLLPILDDGRVVLIKNYRVSIDRTLLEVPAGTMEPNEPPATTARRELIEETGFRSADLQHRRTFYASPGICDEAMHLFVARGLSEGQPDREGYEQIENRIASWEEIRGWIADGTIQDGKTLIALFDFLHAPPPVA
jgi:ADP-ribose pyrophosphatase